MDEAFRDLDLTLPGASGTAGLPNRPPILVQNPPESAGRVLIPSRGESMGPTNIPEARITFAVPSNHPSHPLFAAKNREEKPGFATPEKDRGCVEFLEQVSARPEEYAGYSVTVSRRGPMQFDGEDLPRGPIWTGNPASFREIREYALEKHGGGDFALEIRNGEGKLVHSMGFSWSTQNHAPKVPIEGRPFATRPAGLQYWHREQAEKERERDVDYNEGYAFGGSRFGSSGGGARALGALGGSPADNSLMGIRKSIEEIRALDSLEEAKRELEENRKRRHKRGEGEDDKKIDGLREEVRRVQEEGKATLQQLMLSFKESLLLAMQQGKSNGDGPAILIEAMKSQGTMMQAMLATMASSGAARTGGMEDFLKAQVATQSEFYKTMMEMTRLASEKSDKMADRVLSKQLGSGDEKLANWKEGIEFMMKMQEGLQGNDDDGYDPEAGFMGNLGGLLFSGIKGLIKGGGGGLGQVLAQTAAGRADPPPVEVLPSAPVFGANRAFNAPKPVSVLPMVRTVGGAGEDFSVRSVDNGEGVRVVPFVESVPPSVSPNPVYAEVYRQGEEANNGGKAILDDMLNRAFQEMQKKVPGFGWAESASSLPEDVVRGVLAARTFEDASRILFAACDPAVYRKFTDALKTPEREFALEYLRGGVKKLREVLSARVVQ